MGYFSRGSFRQQASFLRQQFLQEDGLPFSNVFSDGVVAQALETIKVGWLDRIYSPLVTLWVFLGQVLSADPPCRAAVGPPAPALPVAAEDHGNGRSRNSPRSRPRSVRAVSLRLAAFPRCYAPASGE
jgi:hypothetical protein